MTEAVIPVSARNNHLITKGVRLPVGGSYADSAGTIAVDDDIAAILPPIPIGDGGVIRVRDVAERNRRLRREVPHPGAVPSREQGDVTCPGILNVIIDDDVPLSKKRERTGGSVSRGEVCSSFHSDVPIISSGRRSVNDDISASECSDQRRIHQSHRRAPYVADNHIRGIQKQRSVRSVRRKRRDEPIEIEIVFPGNFDESSIAHLAVGAR